MGEYVICVFGSGGVGKSCLTMQFVQNIFMPKYDPTIEDVYKKTIEVDEKQYSLEIFDTAGSEEFSSMRDLYVKNGHGFVIVYSITSQATFDDINEYYERILKVKDIETHGPPPIVLVGNKTDLADERVVSRETGQSLANKWNCTFLETSAKNRADVTEVFFDLIRQINRKIPASQINKSKILYVNQSEPHVSFPEEYSTSQSKVLIEEEEEKKFRCCTLL